MILACSSEVQGLWPPRVFNFLLSVLQTKYYVCVNAEETLAFDLVIPEGT